MARKYVKLTLDRIDEGELANDVDEALDEVGRALFEHRRKYGVEITKGAKATLSLTITVQAGTEDGDYSLKGVLKKTVPGRPARTSVAIQDRDPLTREEGLFCRASGADDASPRQAKLATNAGEAIDAETGEIKEKKP